MITNMMHVGEQRARFTMKDGRKVAGSVLRNDRVDGRLYVESGEGFFEVIDYSDIAHASIPLAGRQG